MINVNLNFTTGIFFSNIKKIPNCLLNLYFCGNIIDMQRAIIYFFTGIVISFLLNYFLLGSQGWALDLYYAVAFGAAWGTAYFLDDEKFTLVQKLGISFLGMIILVLVGTFLFDLEKAVPSVIKFSMVYVAYYVLASFKSSKSLRK